MASWERLRERLKLGAKLGYAYTASAYDFRQRNAQGAQSDLTLSRSYYHASYGQFEAEYYVGRRWLFRGNRAARSDGRLQRQEPLSRGRRHDRYRVELSGHLSAKWRPTGTRIGLAVNLRGELYDRHAVPLIPAFFFDWVVSERGNRGTQSLRGAQLPLPDAQRPLLPAGRTAPTCAPNTASPTTAAYRSHWAAKRRATLRGEATLFDSHRRLDSLGAGAARLLDAPQRPQSPQLRRRDEGRRLGAPLARLAARPRRPLRMDPLDQLRQTGQRRRRLLRQTAGLRPRIRRGRHGDAELAPLDARLQMELLQRTLYHHKQRHVAPHRPVSNPTT